MDESLSEIPEFEISPDMYKYLCTRSGMRAFNAALRNARLNILLVPYSEFTLPPNRVPEDYFSNGNVEEYQGLAMHLTPKGGMTFDEDLG